jgi:hypothetical protein
MHVAGLADAGIDVQYAHAALNLAETQDTTVLARQVHEAADYLWERLSGADVVVFRRGYLTQHLCFECGWAGLDIRAAADHASATGHLVNAGREAGIRVLFDRLERDTSLARRLAVVYETDDDLLNLPETNGAERWMRHERDLMARMMRRADLVTTSTPVLADRLRRFGADVRVVRNAVDPAWFPAPAAPDAGAGVRLLYYGGLGRLEEYVPCAAAMHEQRGPGLTRVWLGAPSAEDWAEGIGRHFDEVHPYVVGVKAFARRLVELGPDVGIAPLADHGFNEAKSELHWLEYSIAGAVTVATQLRRPGPYDVIRNGVDGYLVRRPGDWRQVLRRLVASRDLRAEVSGRARERVLREYTVAARAPEWASAYRDAADRPGVGLAQLERPLPATRATPRRADRRGSRPPADRPGETVPAPVDPGPPSAEAFMGAYVAARAYAGRSPMVLRLGCGGSSQKEATIPRNPSAIVIDTDGSPDIRHHVAFGLPFDDGTVDAVEIDRAFDALAGLTPILLTEVVRVLKPGGRCAIVTRDRDEALARQQRLTDEGVFVRGEAARLPSFTAPGLDRLLREAGFPDPAIAVEGPLLVAVATR